MLSFASGIHGPPGPNWSSLKMLLVLVRAGPRFLNFAGRGSLQDRKNLINLGAARTRTNIIFKIVHQFGSGSP